MKSVLAVPAILAALFFGPILLQITIFAPIYFVCWATGIPYWLPFAAIGLLLMLSSRRPQDVPVEICDSKGRHVATI
jgi:hypothetical protein